MKRNEIKIAWDICFAQWQNGEGDRRDPVRDLPVDFAETCVDEANKPYINGIRATTQRLTAMLGDPMLPKDHKVQLKQLIEASQALVNSGREVING